MNEAEFVLLTGFAYCVICGLFVLELRPRLLEERFEDHQESDSE